MAHRYAAVSAISNAYNLAMVATSASPSRRSVTVVTDPMPQSDGSGLLPSARSIPMVPDAAASGALVGFSKCRIRPLKIALGRSGSARGLAGSSIIRVVAMGREPNLG